MNIGENIRKIREEKGMMQLELAERIGVTSSMLSQIERGSKSPSLPLGVAIAKVLECSIEDLIKE